MKNKRNLHNKFASIGLIILGLLLLYATISMSYMDGTVRTFLVAGIIITIFGIFLFIKNFGKKS